MGEQFILKIEGALDADGARRVARELRALVRDGMDSLVLDCSALNYALPEGVMELTRLAQALDAEGDLRVLAADISPAVLPVFSLFGPAVADRRCILFEQRTGQCPHCNATLRLQQAGAYRCPACGRELRLLESGDLKAFDA